MNRVWILIVAAAIAAGCDSNPTNEPSAASIEQANADRLKAIENDPNMTPEGKAKMIEMLKLKGASADGSRPK